MFKPFMLPIYKKYKEQSAKHHHKNAISKMHRNSSGQITQLLYKQPASSDGAEKDGRALAIKGSVHTASFGAIQTNCFRSTLIRQERNYEH